MLEESDSRSQAGSHGGLYLREYQRDDWDTKSRKDDKMRAKKKKRREADDTKSVRSYKSFYTKKSVVGLENKGSRDPMEVLSVIDTEETLRERAGKRKQKKSSAEVWDTVSQKATGIQANLKSKAPKRDKPRTIDDLKQHDRMLEEYREEHMAMVEENPEYSSDLEEFTIAREREAVQLKSMLEPWTPPPPRRPPGGRYPQHGPPPPHPARYPLPTTPMYGAAQGQQGGFLSKILGKGQQGGSGGGGRAPAGGGGVVRLSDAMSNHKEYAQSYNQRMQGRRGSGGAVPTREYDDRGRHDSRGRDRSRDRYDSYPQQRDQYNEDYDAYGGRGGYGRDHRDAHGGQHVQNYYSDQGAYGGGGYGGGW